MNFDLPNEYVVIVSIFSLFLIKMKRCISLFCYITYLIHTNVYHLSKFIQRKIEEKSAIDI